MALHVLAGELRDVGERVDHVEPAPEAGAVFVQLFVLLLVHEIDVVDRQQIPAGESHELDARILMGQVTEVHAHRPVADQVAGHIGQRDVTHGLPETALVAERHDEIEDDAVFGAQPFGTRRQMFGELPGKLSQTDVPVVDVVEFDGDLPQFLLHSHALTRKTIRFGTFFRSGTSGAPAREWDRSPVLNGPRPFIRGGHIFHKRSKHPNTALQDGIFFLGRSVESKMLSHRVVTDASMGVVEIFEEICEIFLKIFARTDFLVYLCSEVLRFI